MKTAIIIDDEQFGIDALHWKIEENFPSISIIDTFVKGADALKFLNENELDIIFLDIEMPSMDGLDFARTYEGNAKIIFTTAHPQYVLEAIKEQAFDYLLKPIDVSELKKTIKRLYNSELNANDNLEENILKVNTSDSIIYIKEANIIYCKSYSNYTTLHLLDGSKQLISKTLLAVESQLSYHFIRIHNSYIVNKDHVIKYNKGIGGSLILVGNIELPVSKSRKPQVLSFLGQ